jgi:Bifunctional DNA primase/polymerase, N-terminal
VTYACLGYRVLPLHHPVQESGAQGTMMRCSCGDPACGAVGKHPLTPHGLKDASSDPAQLTGWWRRWPQANIGLVTGELVDVLDFDGRPGRMALRRLAADHDLSLEGPLAETGIGWHLYLTLPAAGPPSWASACRPHRSAAPAVGPVCQRVRW